MTMAARGQDASLPSEPGPALPLEVQLLKENLARLRLPKRLLFPPPMKQKAWMVYIAGGKLKEASTSGL